MPCCPISTRNFPIWSQQKFFHDHTGHPVVTVNQGAPKQSILLQITFKLIILFYSLLANYPQIDDISNPQPVSSAAGVFYL